MNPNQISECLGSETHPLTMLPSKRIGNDVFRLIYEMACEMGKADKIKKAKEDFIENVGKEVEARTDAINSLMRLRKPNQSNREGKYYAYPVETVCRRTGQLNTSYFIGLDIMSMRNIDITIHRYADKIKFHTGSHLDESKEGMEQFRQMTYFNIGKKDLPKYLLEYLKQHIIPNFTEKDWENAFKDRVYLYLH